MRADHPVALAPVWALTVHRTLFGGRDEDDHCVVVRLPMFKRGDVVTATVSWRGSQPGADEPGVARALEQLLKQIGREHGITIVQAKPAEAFDLGWQHHGTTEAEIGAPGHSSIDLEASNTGAGGSIVDAVRGR